MRKLLLVLVLGGVSLPDDKPSLVQAIDTLVTRLHDGKCELRIGISYPKTKRKYKDYADMVGDIYLPLSKTPLWPGDPWTGTVRIQTDGKERIVTNVEVVLLAEYNLRVATAAVRLAGKKHRLNLEADGEDPNTLFDPDNKGKDLWVALGKGLMVLESSFDD